MSSIRRSSSLVEGEFNTEDDSKASHDAFRSGLNLIIIRHVQESLLIKARFLPSKNGQTREGRFYSKRERKGTKLKASI